MNRKFVFLILSLVFVSGCVIPDISTDVLKQTFNVEAIGGEEEDITINAIFPSFAKRGSEFSWKLEVTPAYDIENFILEVYDRCPLLESNIGETRWPASGSYDIKSERMKMFSTKYKVLDWIPYEGECKIKFKVSYNSTADIIQSISVLETGEYEQRETDETLSEIETHFSKTENPLDIIISFSEEYPFIENDEINMYIDYENKGSGFIDILEAGDVNLSYPKNLEIIECDDYDWEVGFRLCGNNYMMGDIAVKTEENLKQFTYTLHSLFQHELPEVAKYFDFETEEGWRIGIDSSENIIYIIDRDDGSTYDYYTFEEGGNCRTEPTTVKGKQLTGRTYDSYSEVANNILSLNNNLKFYSNKAKRSTCKFKTIANQVIDTGSLNLKAIFNYWIRGEVAKKGKGIDIRK